MLDGLAVADTDHLRRFLLGHHLAHFWQRFLSTPGHEVARRSEHKLFDVLDVRSRQTINSVITLPLHWRRFSNGGPIWPGQPGDRERSPPSSLRRASFRRQITGVARKTPLWQAWIQKRFPMPSVQPTP